MSAASAQGAVGAPVEVVVVPDADVLAAAVAARLLTALADAQAARGSASVVLTGGGVGIALLEQVRQSPGRDAVDWRRVDVWWGDERFVPRDDPERNEGQARAALLDALDLDPARVHPVAAAGEGPGEGSGAGSGDDPGAGLDAEAAAERYAAELLEAGGGSVPAFDVLLLGMGPEGHTASIFPESPAAHDARPVVAVHGCPKPPPTRVSLGFSALQAARQVWVVAAGEAKAPVVASALSGTAGPLQLPVVGAVGRERTLWLLDAAAAAQLD